jgi:hypothetical protein
MTDAGFGILANAIGYAEHLSKTLSDRAWAWPNDGHQARDRWSGIDSYDQQREAYKQMTPRLPQYENIVQPWHETQEMTPQGLRDVTLTEPHYPEGPGGQQSFLERPAALPVPGPTEPDPNWVDYKAPDANNRHPMGDAMTFDNFIDNLQRTPGYAQARRIHQEYPMALSATQGWAYAMALWPAIPMTLTPEVFAEGWKALLEHERLTGPHLGAWRSAADLLT